MLARQAPESNSLREFSRTVLTFSPVLVDQAWQANYTSTRL